MERSGKSERSAFFIPKGVLTHHLPQARGGTARCWRQSCALTQRARQICCRSFAVNSDSFVNHKTMYQLKLTHNGIFIPCRNFDKTYHR